MNHNDDRLIQHAEEDVLKITHEGFLDCNRRHIILKRKFEELFRRHNYRRDCDS